MTIGEVSRAIKGRVQIRGSFLTVTVNKFSGNYKIVGIWLYVYRGYVTRASYLA